MRFNLASASKILAIIVGTLAAALAIFAFSFSPMGPLYSYGNIQDNAGLRGFGFSKPLPDCFLYPADLMQRLTLDKNDPTPESEYASRCAKYGSVCAMEYLPDHTFIHIYRMPIPEGKRGPINMHLLAIGWTHNPHLLPGVPMRVALGSDAPEESKQRFNGIEYDCIQVPMLVKDRDHIRGLLAVRRLKNFRQNLMVEALTPGDKVNTDCVDKLLSSLSLD